MTHYAVGVVLNRLDELDEVMARYDENRAVEEFDLDGNLLSTYNPESKWDWYVIGGRFSNWLRLKNGGTADFAKIKDIDFSLDKEQYDESIRFWEIVVEKSALRENEEEPFTLYKPEYYTERYKTKERFAEEWASQIPFAVVIDGEWYEKGEMGWFAMDDSTSESALEYAEYFKKAIAEADDDSIFVIVDCHI